MDTFEAIRTVLAVRTFREAPIPEEIVREIVEAGRLTASASNQQPWYFIVIREPETLKQLGAVARTGPYIAQAPLAIAVAITESKLAASDASRAIQSMILAAWSRGVGSNWVGYFGLDAAKPLLGIPETMQLFAILPFGYPSQRTGSGGKNRKPLSEVAFRERFGQPFA
jgi:nitroreductase